MMKLCDIRAISDLAHANGALLCVDNTFASPFNQRPLRARCRFHDALLDEVRERAF